MKYCFLDLETTGFDSEQDSIIECSFIVCENGKEIARFDQVFRPDKSPLTEFVSHLTGITEIELTEKGKTFADHTEEIQNLIGESVIIGHNIDFDIRFLIGNGIDIQENPRIDTHELSRILLPLEESYALEILTQKYGFAHESAHRAMSDVEASKDLFEMLEENIKELPQDFLENIKTFLETKTNWYAKSLFLSSLGGDKSPKIQKEKQIETLLDNDISEIPEQGTIKLKNLENSPEILIKVSAKVSENTPVVLVTPRIDFYKKLEIFPTPEVILDPEKLKGFVESRGTLDNAETTFYLKCQYRYFLGYRGVFFFDLFFKERELWKEINAQETSTIFTEILEEKSKHQVLVCSPAAYFRFIDHPIFTDRNVVFDEAETVATECLFAPSKNFSLLPYLNHKDEAVSAAAQFLITRFVREIIEPNLGHQVSRFPQKMCLDERQSLESFVEEMDKFVDDENWDFWKKILSEPPEKSVRYFTYIPDSGNLFFGYWHPDDWRSLKNTLTTKNKIIAKRTAGKNSDLFFKIFLGLEPSEEVVLPTNYKEPKLIIPQDLVSNKSPEFNAFCAAKIEEIFKKTTGNLAVNFSSLETLRSTFDMLNKNITDKDIFLTGEKVAGGNGKLLEIMNKNKEKRMIFLFQKINNPALKAFKFENVIFQKFPFSPPQPLLDKIKIIMDQNGKSFWDIWTMTHIKAEISRRLDSLHGVKNVYFLDPRENAKWGKEILNSIFR